MSQIARSFSCAIPAGTPSSIRSRTWRKRRGPRHVDHRQDARTDVPRTVPGARAYGEGGPELSVRPGSLEPGCLTCAKPHPRMQGRPLGRPSQWLPFLDTYRTMCRAPEPGFGGFWRTFVSCCGAGPEAGELAWPSFENVHDPTSVTCRRRRSGLTSSVT